jgi:hypothetical protein
VDLRTRAAITASVGKRGSSMQFAASLQGAGSENPDSGVHPVDGIGKRQMTDAMAMRMFSRGVIVGLFIGLYIGWVNWAA